MALLLCNGGEVLCLKYMLNNTAPTNVKLHLYTNDKTPAEADVVGNYTACTATGYALKTLTGSSWTVATTDGTTTATYAEQTFTLTTSATVYGYYVTDNAGTGLLWAERFTTAPYNVPSGSISVTPSISLD